MAISLLFFMDHSGSASELDRVLSAVNDQFMRKGGEVSIMDYYGTKAAKVDMAYVILCEVLHILCHHKSLFEEVEHIGANPSVSIDNRLVGIAFKEYARTHGCVYSSEIHSKKIVPMKWTAGAPPKRKYNLQMLTEHSLTNDANLRKKYGSVILHGNRTANEAAAVPYYVSVDRSALLANSTWLAAFSAKVSEFKSIKGYCSSVK